MARTHNQVRIIGGKWKRRKLTFPDRPELRPSLDRARETLFNWLSPELPGRRCLDLFAGSGALGFEAASRGAAAVTLVDRDPFVVRALVENQQRLEADECQVIRASALAWLDQQEQGWPIVFLDPPFQSTLSSQVIEVLLGRKLILPTGLLVLESASNSALGDARFDVLKDKTFGSTRIQILKLL